MPKYPNPNSTSLNEETKPEQAGSDLRNSGELEASDMPAT